MACNNEATDTYAYNYVWDWSRALMNRQHPIEEGMSKGELEDSVSRRKEFKPVRHMLIPLRWDEW